MGEVKFEVPDEIEEDVRRTSGFDWSSFITRAIRLKAFELEMEQSAKMRRLLTETISSKSGLSEKEADSFAVDLGRKLKEGRLEDLKEAGAI